MKEVLLISNELSTPSKNEITYLSERPDIETITAKIHGYNRQFGEFAYDVGKLLIEAKVLLGHGKWLVWLRERVEFSEATARRFKRIAEEYPNRSTVTELGFSKAIVLLKIPNEERTDFINAKHTVSGKEKTVAEMSCRELRELVRSKSSSVTLQEDDSDEEGIEEPETSYHKNEIDPTAYVKDIKERIDGMLDYLDDLADDIDKRDWLSNVLRAVCQETLIRLIQVAETEAEAS